MPTYDDNHRRPEPMDTDENPNTDAPMALTSGTAASGHGRAGQHGETQITYGLPYTYLNPIPDTVTCKMPYYVYNKSVTCLPGSATAASTVTSFSYRLNSIYDCEATYTYAANPTAAADSADGTVNTPMYRSYWANFFQYWTVLSSTIKVKIRQKHDTTFMETLETFCYVYHHGLQGPPLLNSDSTYRCAHQFRKHHPCLKYYGIIPKLAVLATHGYRDPNIISHENFKYKGYYNKNTVKHEVVEDELNQTWHKATEVPPQREYATFILQAGPNNLTQTHESTITYLVDVEIMYTVQWKDRKAAYEYPTGTEDISIVDYSLQGN